MKPEKNRLPIAGMFTAIIFIATYLLQVPAFTGNINCGDGIILYATLWLGYGAVLPAALGSALSDILSGYVVYAPATLLIKALMAVVSVLLLRAFGKHIAGRILAFCVAEIVMISGYFLFDTAFYGLGGALLNVGSNSIQAVVAVLLGTLFSMAYNPLRGRTGR